MARTYNCNFKKKKNQNNLITANSHYIALRIPNNYISLQVISNFNGIVGPSANKYNKISPTSKNDVIDELGNKVNYILDGKKEACNIGIESTIIKLDDISNKPLIVRKGMIDKSKLEKNLGYKFSYQKNNNSKLNIPGNSKNHYCPNAILLITKNIKKRINNFLRIGLKIGIIIFNNFNKLINKNIISIEISCHENIYAKNLYKNLRFFDKNKVDIIMIEKIPQNEKWFGIRDRIYKASIKKEHLIIFKNLKKNLINITHY